MDPQPGNVSHNLYNTRPVKRVPTGRNLPALLLPCLFAALMILPSHTSAQQGPGTKSPLQDYFTAPDTICVGMPVNIVNNVSALVFDWVFCTGNTLNPPNGQNFFNSGNKLSRPKFITVVKDSGIYYTFITSAGNRAIIRIKNGASLMNPPISSLPVFISGIPSDKMRGIQVKLDSVSGVWVGFFSSGSSLTRMVFQGGLSKTPNVFDIPFPGVSASSGLILVKEGQQWVGFTVDSVNSTVSRLKFNNSLLNIPTVEQLGNIGSLSGPTGLCHVNYNGENCVFISNSASNSITRLDFGASLLLTPSGVNLGNVGGLLNKNTGISIIADCQHINGIVCNWITTATSLIQLNFTGGIKGTINASVANPAGDPYQPFGMSELIRIADTVFGLYVNEGNSTLSQLNFPPCTAATPASSTLQDPGPVVYNSAGDYNIVLTIFGGVHGSGSFCKPIHVLPELTVDLGGDRTICQGMSASLDAGAGFKTYLWSTGDTTSQIQAADSMKYWVRVTNKYGCVATDTAFVHKTPAPRHTLDTTICYGQKYYAGGKYQTQSGNYTDTLRSPAGCDSILHTNLTVKPRISLDIGGDTVLCPGDTYVLDATTPGASAYMWQDGSAVPKYTVTQPGLYWVRVTLNECYAYDTANIEPCPWKVTFPTAFTPNNDGANDEFQAVGISITNFHLDIFDRWGTLVFSADDISRGWDGMYKNKPCPAGVYIYDATFEAVADPGSKIKEHGTFTLIR